VQAPEKAKETVSEQEGYVNKKVTSYLNVRKKASTTSGIVCRLPKGHAVKVVSESGNWYKIKTTYESKEVSGYVAKEYITIGKKDATEEQEEKKAEDPALVPDADFEKQVAAFPALSGKYQSFKTKLSKLELCCN
jgi:hypothetical protein